jgi:hypothetical protein
MPMKEYSIVSDQIVLVIVTDSPLGHIGLFAFLLIFNRVQVYVHMCTVTNFIRMGLYLCCVTLKNR